jgi:hypothetical protein
MKIPPPEAGKPPSPFAKGGSWRKSRAKEVSPLSKRGAGGISHLRSFSLFKYLQNIWTPVFTGVTAFCETVRVETKSSKPYKNKYMSR